MMKCTLSLFFLMAFVAVALGRLGDRSRCVTIRGRVTCGPDRPNAPKKPTKIRIMQVVGQRINQADEPIDTAYVADSGNFMLQGCVQETRNFRFRPYIQFLHECAGHRQRWTYEIPDQHWDRTYDMGNVSLLNPDFRMFTDNHREAYSNPIMSEC